MERILAWSPLLTPLIMLLSLIVSAYIGLLVYQFTRRQAQMVALQLVHSRWQELNKIIIDRPNVQRLLGDHRFDGKSDEEIVAYNFLFQILNVAHEIHFAAGRGLIDPAFARQVMAGNADILRRRRREVLEMLAWNRGYDPAFSRQMTQLLGDLP